MSETNDLNRERIQNRSFFGLLRYLCSRSISDLFKEKEWLWLFMAFLSLGHWGILRFVNKRYLSAVLMFVVSCGSVFILGGPSLIDNYRKFNTVFNITAFSITFFLMPFYVVDLKKIVEGSYLWRGRKIPFTFKMGIQGKILYILFLIFVLEGLVWLFLFLKNKSPFPSFF